MNIIKRYSWRYILKKNTFSFLLITLILAPFWLYSSETSSTQDIFDRFKTGPFGLPITDRLFESPEGQNFLLGIRASETLKSNLVCQVKKDSVCVTGSILYSDQSPSVIYESKIKAFVPGTNSTIQLLTTGIALVEDCLVAYNNPMPDASVNGLELTRVHDLFLLKKILEHLRVRWSVDVYSLPEILYATHQQWPPENLAVSVHPTSAYTVVKAALAVRKANKIDE